MTTLLAAPARRLLRAALLASALLGPSLAGAQVGGRLTLHDTERFRPPAMAEGALGVGTAEVPVAGTWRLALAGHTSWRPVVLDLADQVRGGGYSTESNDGDLIGLHAAGLLTFAYALPHRIEVHAGLPVVVAQTSQDRTRVGIQRPANSGLGTPWLGARFSPLAQADGAPFSLAVAAEVLPPLGSKEALAGNSTWAFAPRIELGHRDDEAVFGLELGYLRRGERLTLGLDTVRDEIQTAVVVAGAAGTFRAEVGVHFDYMPGPGLFGAAVLIGGRADYGPVEVFLLAGPGFGSAPGLAELRGMFGVAWVQKQGG